MEINEKTLNEITNEMLHLDVNEYTEEKNRLTYLSWANAVKEALKIDASFEYEIVKNNEGIPIFGNNKIGYMTYTRVTFKNKTRECWLAIMDGGNKAIKDESYTYDTRNKKGIVVPSLDMTHINKTVMRCLTKNLAMFGLGLYIYAGEDLPEIIEEPIIPITSNQLKQINILILEMGVDTKVQKQKEKIYKWMGIESLKTIGSKKAIEIIAKLKEAKKQKEAKK